MSRPFRLFGNSQLQNAADNLRHRVDQWASAWGIEACELRLVPVSNCLPEGCDQSNWRKVEAGDNLALFFSPGELRESLWKLLFRTEKKEFPRKDGALSQISISVIETCISQLCKSIFLDRQDVFRFSNASPGWLSPFQKPGMGALAAELTFRDLTITVVLNPSCVSCLIPQQDVAPNLQEIERIENCLNGQVAKIEVWAGEAELDLETLVSLQPGDVIRLDSKLNQPLRLSVSGVSTMHGCYLGKTGSKTAIQLTSNSKQ